MYLNRHVCLGRLQLYVMIRCENILAFQPTDLQITNLKVSIKIKFEKCLLNILKSQIKNIYKSRHFQTYSVITPFYSSSLRFIIFRKIRQLQHINCTGVNSLEALKDAIKYLCSTFDISNADICQITIDNITGVSNCLTYLSEKKSVDFLNLPKLSRFINVNCPTIAQASFNGENFSALVFRSFGSVILIYATSKIVIISGKSVEQIQKALSLLKEQSWMFVNTCH